MQISRIFLGSPFVCGWGGGGEGGVIGGGRNEYLYHIENVVQIFRIEILDFKVLLGVKFQLVIRASSWLSR